MTIQAGFRRHVGITSSIFLFAASLDEIANRVSEQRWRARRILRLGHVFQSAYMPTQRQEAGCPISGMLGAARFAQW
jgi:hypothetical protein